MGNEANGKKNGRLSVMIRMQMATYKGIPEDKTHFLLP